MPDIFALLDGLAARFDFEGVEREALAALKEHGGDERADLWSYVAWARFELGRLGPALAAAQEADDPLLMAKAHFHLWNLDDARQCLARFVGDEDELAEAEWYRGLLCEFVDEDPTPHFRRAALLAGDLFHEPVRLPEAEVEAVVRAAVDSLPEAVRAAVENAVIELRALPAPHPDVDPLTLGVYDGRDPLRDIGDGNEDPMLRQARIELYLRNIERVARDRDEAVQELRITLLHEIGHHVGMDEDDLESLGYG